MDQAKDNFTFLNSPRVATNNKIFELTVSSCRSMSPLFHNNDVIVVQRVMASEIKAGDILVFIANQRVLAHRCLYQLKDTSEPHFITKGDSSRIADSFPVNQATILGKITIITRNGYSIKITGPIWEILNYGIALFSNTQNYLTSQFEKGFNYLNASHYVFIIYKIMLYMILFCPLSIIWLTAKKE